MLFVVVVVVLCVCSVFVFCLEGMGRDYFLTGYCSGFVLTPIWELTVAAAFKP